jgi:hypothetical protein
VSSVARQPAQANAVKRFLINESDLSSLHNRHHVVDHQCFLKTISDNLLVDESICWGTRSSYRVFKRALRKDRPNAVDRHRPDPAKTVNAAFA